MSEVQKSADSVAAASASASGRHEEPDSPAIDQHYVYSLRDFQPFESATYQGIYLSFIERIFTVYMRPLRLLLLLSDLLQVS